MKLKKNIKIFTPAFTTKKINFHRFSTLVKSYFILYFALPHLNQT